MRDFPIPIRSGVNIERPMNKNIVKRILSIGLAEIKDVAVLVLPGFSTAFSLADIESSKNIDDRVARLDKIATRKATRTGIIAGIIIGLVTGIVSGYAVWFTTKGDAVKFSHSTPSKAPAASPNTK
jgi:hypothetical protein